MFNKGIKNIYFITFFVFVFVHSGQGQKIFDFNKKYSPLQLKEDATIAKNALLKMHPVIGLYDSKDYFEGRFNEFINSLNDSLTEKQFRLKLKIMIQHFRCGHTDVFYSSRYVKASKKRKNNYPGYFLMPFNDTVKVITGLNKKTDTLLKTGTVITKINGIKADSLLNYIKQLITADGYVTESKSLYSRLAYNTNYLSLLNHPDTLQFECSNDGKTCIKKIATFKANTFPELKYLKKTDSTYTNYKKAAISYKFIDSDKKTLRMNIHRFSGNKFAKAYRKIFRQMRNNKAENLIIDIRGNGGGSLTNCNLLLRYLLNRTVTQTSYTHVKKFPDKKYTGWNMPLRMARLFYRLAGHKVQSHDTDIYTLKIRPFKKHHYDGKIFVLIDGGSFSASCMLAEYLKETNRAVFVGRETGGTASGCNAVTTTLYKLPNTGLRVRVPAFRLKHDVFTGVDKGRGILPDYEITPTLQSFLSKTDLELEKVKELIK